MASLGLPVLGVDVAETALTLAREKAHQRRLDTQFAVADALHLERLGRRFKTVIDSGLFHTFNAEEQAKYAQSLASAAEPGATLYVLCFSNEGPELRPHPVTRSALQAAFHIPHGWKILTINPDRIHTRFHTHGISAWLATIQRVSSPSSAATPAGQLKTGN